jgi:hypothetical protein
MYLLYADESGDLTDPDTKVFVVAAIAVHEDAVRPLAAEINGTMNKFLGKKVAEHLELHGSPMRAGAGGWDRHRIPQKKVHGLYHALLKKLDAWEHTQAQTGIKTGIECFAVAMDRNHSQSPTETTYGELLHGFDTVLRAKRKEGFPNNGVLIADESKYERTLQAWVEVARATESRPTQDPRRLYALAESPFFVDSRVTRLIQLADLLGHALYRGYNANDWPWAESALPAVSRPGRLRHFTDDVSCSCPACT